jgi:hypothetical protein
LVQGEDYGSNQGEYFHTDDKVRGRNTWVSQSVNGMIFYSGDSWGVTNTKFKDEIMNETSTGSFAHSNNDDVPYKAD